MKIGVYASGRATRFKQLVDLPIAFLLTDGEDVETDIPVFKIVSRHVSDRYLGLLRKYNCEYGYVFGTRILTGDLLEEYKNRLINFHPSLLPAFPGMCAIDQANDANSFLLGNTAHFITSEVDAGPVIMQNIVPKFVYQNYETVLSKQVPMAKQICKWLIEKRITVENGIVYVKDASYKVTEFIPNLEDHF